MGKLSGKYAVVTGGGQGIGRAIVEAYIKEDVAGVVVLDYNTEVAEKMRSEVAPDRISVVGCDVSDRASVEAAFEQVSKLVPQVDILVNNAGITRDAMIHKMDYSNFERVLKTNLFGAFSCTQMVAPGMRERKYGKIIFIGSVNSSGQYGQSNYASSKAGILGLCGSVAKELAKYNVTANVIEPGYIITDILNTVPQKMLDDWINLIPMRRMAKPEELGPIAVFLACDDSSFVTGNVIRACGGAKMDL